MKDISGLFWGRGQIFILVLKQMHKYKTLQVLFLIKCTKLSPPLHLIILQDLLSVSQVFQILLPVTKPFYIFCCCCQFYFINDISNEINEQRSENENAFCKYIYFLFVSKITSYFHFSSSSYGTFWNLCSHCYLGQQKFCS